MNLMALLEGTTLARPEDGMGRLIVAARFWVGFRKRGIDPGPAIAQRLGSDAAAWRFWLLMEEIGTAWPDPFMVSPPCCGRMSMDESTLHAMLRAAGRSDRVGFVRLVEDLLPLEISERLYASCRALLDELAQPAS